MVPKNIYICVCVCIKEIHTCIHKDIYVCFYVSFMYDFKEIRYHRGVTIYFFQDGK